MNYQTHISTGYDSKLFVLCQTGGELVVKAEDFQWQAHFRNGKTDTFYVFKGDDLGAAITAVIEAAYRDLIRESN